MWREVEQYDVVGFTEHEELEHEVGPIAIHEE